ncbi:hypothetical protein Trco_007524 [Trichoderma cornu-damae]|uniref:Glycine-rich cell wall structural protein 1 n=1 Tax=Trichoderma cornu-damae TaxID=654480 RepID=A0A9P8QJX7_9HYPO|nr:hypothetical protein Trco_007524 [Trichoderma cornu-damae]
MEAINQIATFAARAVWGDSSASETETHREPISGATGDVSKGEPYDAGNLDAKGQSRVESSLSGEADKSSPPECPGPDLADDRHDDDLSSAAAKAKDEPPPGKPRGPRDDAAAADAGAERGGPPGELTGEGPRPVEIAAKHHGGSFPSAPGQERPEAGIEQGAEHVKKAGLAADGGDFDAAKPGAGREADRLMEQKALKADDAVTKGGGTGRKSSESSHHHHKDRPSLGERIKNKLHRH